MERYLELSIFFESRTEASSMQTQEIATYLQITHCTLAVVVAHACSTVLYSVVVFVSFSHIFTRVQNKNDGFSELRLNDGAVFFHGVCMQYMRLRI
jgi:hypothetical protein